MQFVRGAICADTLCHSLTPERAKNWHCRPQQLQICRHFGYVVSGMLAAWQAVGVSTRFEGFEMRKRQREQRVVHTVALGTVEHPPEDVIGLRASAVLEVAQHRRAPWARWIGQSGSGEFQP